MAEISTLCETLSGIAAYHAQMAERLTMPEMVTLGDFVESLNAAVTANTNHRIQNQVNHDKARLFQANCNDAVYGRNAELPDLEQIVPQKSVTAIVFQDNQSAVVRPAMSIVYSRFANQDITTPVPYEQPAPLPANVVRFDRFRKQTLAA